MNEWFTPQRRILAAGVFVAIVVVVVAAVALSTGGSDDGSLTGATGSVAAMTTPAEETTSSVRRSSTTSSRPLATVWSGSTAPPASSGSTTLAAGAPTSATTPTTRTTARQVAPGPTRTTVASPAALPPSPTPPPPAAAPPDPAPPAAPPAPPPPLPQAVITLAGSDPPAGHFGVVALSVSSSDGTTPMVDVVGNSGCQLTGAGTASLTLGMPTFNIPFEGERCTVRASGTPAAGFTKADDKELTIQWTPVIGRATWSSAVRNGDKVTVTMFTSHGIPGVGTLRYSPDACTGPRSNAAGAAIEITAPGACTVTGEPHELNQTTWVVVEPLVIPPP